MTMDDLPPFLRDEIARVEAELQAQIARGLVVFDTHVDPSTAPDPAEIEHLGVSIADAFNLPPHLLGVGPRRPTWRIRRWDRLVRRRLARLPIGLPR